MSSNNFSMYDFLAYLLPGSIVGLTLFFYGVSNKVTAITEMGDGVFGATAFLVASFLVGHFVQAVSSWPWSKLLLGWLTFGDARDRLFKDGLKKLSTESWLEAKRLVLMTNRVCNTNEKAYAYNDHEAYQTCLSASRGLGKADEFNAVYALNRGMSMVLILMLIACVVMWIRDDMTYVPTVTSLVILLVQLYRFRQRGEYLVVEVVKQAQLAAPRKQ